MPYGFRHTLRVDLTITVEDECIDLVQKLRLVLFASFLHCIVQESTFSSVLIHLPLLIPLWGELQTSFKYEFASPYRLPHEGIVSAHMMVGM